MTPLASLVVSVTSCVTVFTRFQLSSTALTVTLNAVPAVCVVGVPVLPVLVPGAAVSFGINTCNFVAVPALIVTLPLVPVFPVPEVAVKVPVVALPVYFIPSVVRVATPELKSPAPVNLFPPDSPDTAPVSGEFAAIVTLSADASKVVIV